jgi:ATP/maltotriose-dependent transcriptional regulator MalT
MALRRVLSSTSNRLQRARLLPAAVEIALAAGELDDARTARDELASLASDVGTPGLGAMAAHARGAVALAEGHAAAAIEPLRQALQVWNEVGAPYLAARLRVLLAQAYRALGDRDSAGLEIELARETFTTLGAAPDLSASPGEIAHEGHGVDLQPAPAGGLSARELEVLRLVTTGKTNKVIAQQLFISEKTIDRHVSNIFVKLNVASRAAATAYAYQHGLV